jgi:hypothetical protein
LIVSDGVGIDDTTGKQNLNESIESKKKLFLFFIEIYFFRVNYFFFQFDYI